ncbi:MAG: hypothetical protein JWQ40_1656 [Segetibacter sp.]|nr:hypothetical protein [Segetibacter sp.]
MKTSNKILTGLIVVVFTVPLLLAYSLKSKMKKGEYTVKKNDDSRNEGNMRSGSFTAFKVVKVVAPNPEFLTCHFKQSDNMNYKYYNYQRKDSVIVFTSNDTLYIQYLKEKASTNGNESGRYNHFEIDVNLPAFSNLVVDGAVVVLDSASSANLSVSLKNNGEIKDGGEKREEDGAKASRARNNNYPVVNVTTADKTIVRSGDKGNVVSARNTSSTLLDLDIKELLIYGLLYRI